MAYDEKLVTRIDSILEGRLGITKKKMFGGLCYLHNGNMLCGVMKAGELMVRVGPDQYEKALKAKHCREMDFTGRPLKGLVYVAKEGLKTKSSLSQWLDMGLWFTSALLPK